MKITELLLAELDREAVGTRKTLQRVPEGQHAGMGRYGGESGRTGHQSAGSTEVQATGVENAERSAAAIRNEPEGKGREVLQKTTDDRLLNTKWRMLAAGKPISEQPRYVAIRDGVLNHMAHHRGQLTVYLRLSKGKVPPVYGPSVDEGKG